MAVQSWPLNFPVFEQFSKLLSLLETSAKEVSKIVRILENPPNKTMSLLTGSGGSVLSPSESLSHLLQAQFPEGELEGLMITNDDPMGVDFTGICQYISPWKVKAAFASFGDYKSPGPDGIPPKVLKCLDETTLEIVCLLYKLSLATGKVPMIWRIMDVVFIPKSGKKDYSIPKSYRPITLSNFLLKGLERLIQWYILEYIIVDPFYNQHAYTKGRSCDSALSSFVNDVECAVYNGRQLIAVSLDCSGAFDCIQYESARRCMTEAKIPENIIHWYMNLLTGRKVNARVQGQTSFIIPKRGSPQGGVLSPLVWNIIMDSFLSKYKSGPVRVLGYADDILIYVMGTNPLTMQELIQPALDKVIEWGDTNGLIFNPQKTSAVWFSRGNRVPESHIRLRETPLIFSRSFKYLGVEIHRKLSWNSHVVERTNKCKSLLMKCRNLVHRSWGLTPKRIDWIYKAIVRPKMTYGAVVWAHNLNLSAQKHLIKVQRLALLMITQPLRSTPTAGLEVIMGWLPLPLHAQEIGINSFIRVKDHISSQWDGIGKMNKIRGHLRLWSKKIYCYVPFAYPTEIRLNKYVWIDKAVKGMTSLYPLVVYTDASVSGSNVGYGWIATIGDHIHAEDYSLAKNINIFQAELLAIIEALRWLRNNLLRCRSIKIYCDSQSVVTVLNGHTANSSQLYEALTLIREINKLTRLDVMWIKSHNNTTGNEIADMLAKKGSKEAGNLQYAPLLCRSQ